MRKYTKCTQKLKKHKRNYLNENKLLIFCFKYYNLFEEMELNSSIRSLKALIKLKEKS
jgi:hypothetical protein